MEILLDDNLDDVASLTFSEYFSLYVRIHPPSPNSSQFCLCVQDSARNVGIRIESSRVESRGTIRATPAMQSFKLTEFRVDWATTFLEKNDMSNLQIIV